MSSASTYPTQGPPQDFDPNDPKEPGSGHFVGKDCHECHQVSSDQTQKFVWDHSSKNPDICLPCHFDDGNEKHQGNPLIQLSGYGNCTNCHKNFDKNQQRNFEFSIDL